MAPRYTFADDGPDGGPCILMDQTALPCPGVALRMNTVIDCRPGEERMAPITIEILKNLPAPEQQQGGGAPQLAGRFTCDCGDFVLFNQIRRVEAMVEEAGLPPECAPSLTCFFHRSASSGTNTFFKAVAITVEAGDPRSIVVDEYEAEGEDEEEVPPGADAGECAICYRAYLVGGDTSAALACGHAFHRRCLDRWTSVRRTCPYCRAPVPEELEYWDDGEDDDEDADEEYHAEYDEEEYEYRPGYYGGDMPPPGDGEEERHYQVPGGETPSADAIWGSQPC